jgi:signal peptidase II
MVKQKWGLFSLIIILVTALDQVTKILIFSYVDFSDSVPVIPGLFNIVHNRNRGMAFGLFNDPDPGPAFFILTCASVFAVILIIFWFSRLKEHEKPLIPGLALILGGALGNLIDRLRIGEVIDFLDIQIGSYHWPAFNIADSCISIGTTWVVVCLLFFINPDQ